MKSQTDGLLEIASGIIKDVQMAYPAMRGLELDLKRLTQLVKNRGLGVFTLDLPKKDEQLLAALSSGSLEPCGRRSRFSKAYPVPRLFAGLYMEIFDKALCLKPEADANAILFLRQLCCLGKKIELQCSRKRLLSTIEEYISIEEELQPPTYSWDADVLDLDSDYNRIHLRDHMVAHLPLFDGEPENRERIKILLDRCQRVADVVSGAIGIFCPECFINKREAEYRGPGFRHGPGAVAQRGGRYFDKYQFTHWPKKLNNVFPYDLYGKMPNGPEVKLSLHETPARLIDVPKTAKGPRLIAAEPTEHMYTQQVTRSFLEERVRDTFLGSFINFKRQDLSGEMALASSRDQSLATVDLSSASDRLTCKTVERMFRNNHSLLRTLHASRTRWISIPQKGTFISLKKFASQGTAVTFPIQTIVFLVCALSVSLNGSPTEQNIRKLRGRVRVFGDDIIIPKDRYADLVDLLTTLQLKVNINKSFVDGNFRESCGVDAFKGYDVTPTRPKTTNPDGPASCQALIDTSNNLFYKGFWHASKNLEDRLRSHSRKRWATVGRGAGATGFGSFSFASTLSALVKRIASCRGEPSGDRYIYSELCRLFPSRAFRYNRRLSRYEVRIETIRNRSAVRPFDCGYSGLLHRAISPRNPKDISIQGVSGVPERPTLRNQSRWEDLSNLIGEAG